MSTLRTELLDSFHRQATIDKERSLIHRTSCHQGIFKQTKGFWNHWLWKVYTRAIKRC